MKIGYQLFSAIARCQGAEALKNTIRKVAAIGYDGVEFCSYEGVPAKEMKKLLAKCGLGAFNSHVQLERWEADAEGELRYAAELEMPFVTIPWIAPELRSGEGYDKIRALIVRLTALAEEYPVKILYHNHDFEFAKAGDGRFVLDTLLAVDPKLGLELDTFWADYAGVDAVDYMRKQQDRLAMIHVKDYFALSGGGNAGGQEMPRFCAIGDGKMNNKPILACAKEKNLPWVIVEQDNSEIDVLESAARSIAALKASV